MNNDITTQNEASENEPEQNLSINEPVQPVEETIAIPVVPDEIAEISETVNISEETPPEVLLETEILSPIIEADAAIITTIIEPEKIDVSELKSEEIVADSDAKEEDKEAPKQKSARQERLEKLFAEIQATKDKNESIEVEITNRIRGGLRVVYHELPMFLPASHFSLKRTPTEQELKESIGQKIKVHIHELQEYDEGRKAVIVSRKKILLEEFWDKISTGDIVEGKISSIASFGVFVDIGGVEGLIHISRLSQVHIDDPKIHFKKGDIIQSVIIEIDKEKNRIALSRKELEAPPWKGIEETHPVGTQHTGIVRRLTDFGAYIELRSGVDGLLRVSELSWTKRVKHPSDMLKPGQEIQVEILSISEEKQTASLSYKKTLPNPWNSMVERFPVGTELEGIVTQVMPQGAIVSIADDVDGFMPRSKMRKILKGKKIPYQSGEKAIVIIADINPDEESLILAPKIDEDAIIASEEHEKRRQTENNRENPKPKPAQNSSFSLGDLLSENEKNKLDSMSK